MREGGRVSSPKRRFSLLLTRHDDGSALVQALEEVLLEGVVVERAVDVGGSDGRERHAYFGKIGLALVLALVPALRVHRVLLF